MMAAVALALDEQPTLPSPRGGGSPHRSHRRRQKIPVRHDCHRWHGPEGRAFYATSITRCTIHDTVMLELGEYGRAYPAPVCFLPPCMPPHERLCPMVDASVLQSYLVGLTCVCESRLSILGLKIQKVPGPARARVWAVGPA